MSVNITFFVHGTNMNENSVKQDIISVYENASKVEGAVNLFDRSFGWEAPLLNGTADREKEAVNFAKHVEGYIKTNLNNGTIKTNELINLNFLGYSHGGNLNLIALPLITKMAKENGWPIAINNVTINTPQYKKDAISPNNPEDPTIAYKNAIKAGGESLQSLKFISYQTEGWRAKEKVDLTPEYFSKKENYKVQTDIVAKGFLSLGGDSYRLNSLIDYKVLPVWLNPTDSSFSIHRAPVNNIYTAQSIAAELQPKLSANFKAVNDVFVPKVDPIVKLVKQAYLSIEKRFELAARNFSPSILALVNQKRTEIKNGVTSYTLASLKKIEELKNSGNVSPIILALLKENIKKTTVIASNSTPKNKL